MDAKTEHAPSPTETTELRYLDARTLHFFRRGAILRLTVEDDRSYLKVTVVRVFPLSRPQRPLSVRDGANKEVGILVDDARLDPESRRLVQEEIERRYLTPTIQRVVAIKERFGTVEWSVETDRGPWKFTMRNPRENVIHPTPGRYLLTDVDGNRFDVRDLAALDAPSQAWILRFL
jgi:Domain of unknown function (DUF1854)